MKKIALTLIALMAVAGFTSAVGLDFHLGAGYQSAYYSSINDLDGLGESLTDAATTMPLGVGGYVGIGLGLGPMKLFNLGLEFAPSWVFNLSKFNLTNLSMQLRLYFKFKLPAKIFTASLLTGYNINLNGNYSDPIQFVGTPIIGLRVTIAFIYLEYATNFRTDFSGLGKHEIGLGIAIFK